MRGGALAVRGAVVVSLLVAVAVAVATAATPVGSDFRISTTGADGDLSRAPLIRSAVAANPAVNEYLVVWTADSLPTDNEFEVFGQRISASGAEIGGDFRISTVGADGDPLRGAGEPDVAYNSVANEYLVVWAGDGLATANEEEVFGQRISATGTEIGTEFRISRSGPETDPTISVEFPAVDYNSLVNEYLVVWESELFPTDNEDEIFGQRVSAAGAEIGSDFRISNQGVDGNHLFDASAADIAYNRTGNEFLVVWLGDNAADNEFEVFAQRVSAAGAQVGADFRLSTTGTDGDTAHEAFDPAVAYGSAPNEYLVVWAGDALLDDDFEIFGQRVSGAGAEVGSDFRVSHADAAGRVSFVPAVAYSSTANEYLVAFQADQLATNDEFEIFGQRIGAGGSEIGSDFRITNIGADGDTSRITGLSAVAHNPTAGEYLVTSWADGLLTDNEFEIFSRRLGASGGPPPGPPPPPPDASPKCAGKTATVFRGATASRVFAGSARRDVIVGTSGRDTIRAGGGNDLVCSGGGKDKVIGGAGKDTLRAEAGPDTLKGGTGKDKLIGGGGNDKLFGGPGSDRLNGGPGRDTQTQ